ncbi:MAG: hypothetical protein HC842_02510 [Cytophagales bacterium]|nr:hypothetical protein [Cytophagales bacterium]
MGDAFVSYGLYATYILFGLALVGSVGLPLVNAISNPRLLLRTGISLGAILLIYFISYALSGSEVTPLYVRFGVNAGQSKLIGGGLGMVWFLLGLAFIAALVLEVKKMLNK